MVFASLLNAQTINTVAGNGVAGSNGDGGQALIAELQPSDVAFDTSGALFIIDYNNETLRKISNLGIITTFRSSISDAFAVDLSNNNLFIDEYAGCKVYKFSNSVTTLIVGNCTASGPDPQPAYPACLHFPSGLTVDRKGNLYICDTQNYKIRKVDTSGVIYTVAGSSTGGFSGDGGIATSAQINNPGGITADKFGNIYFADSDNRRVRKIDTLGIINTIAGTGTMGYSGDGGSAILADLSKPTDVEVDFMGNIYIADMGNSTVSKINTSGIIGTIAGNGTNGYSGDGGLATSAQLKYPLSITFDKLGNLYIADWGNNRVRKVDNVAGLNSILNKNPQLTVWPNPASKEIIIQSSIEFGNISIYNAIGEIAFQAQSKNKTEQLDISNLPDGIYFLKLETKEGIVSKKIIVQH